MIFDYDTLANPFTKGMTKKQISELAEKNRKQFYTGIYAPDTVADRDYYKKHKAELESQEEE